MWQLSQPFFKMYQGLNKELYFTGHTVGQLDINSTSSSLIDLALSDGRLDDYWKGCTITMLSGEAEGETVTVSSFIGSSGTFSISPSLSKTPSIGDRFRINAIEVENLDASHNRLYIALNSTTSKAEIKSYDISSPPSNSVVISKYDTGTNFDNYDDKDKCNNMVSLSRVQSCTFSLDLSREEIGELGLEELVDRKDIISDN